MAVVVSSLSDSGAGTLRQAITDINAATATSPITFSVTGTITLASALPAINKNLTITGPGLSSLTISGNNLYRVFDITTGFTVSISGLTISSGRANSGTGISLFGGGIRNGTTGTGSALTVDSCYFTGCYAGSLGGGIFSYGTLNVTNTSFVSNTAIGNGSGIGLIAGTSTIGNCTFSGNTGSAFYTQDPSTIYNCTFNGNTSASAAAAIYLSTDPTEAVYILSSTISGNTSTSGAGGVYKSEYGTVTVKNSIISGNTGTVTATDFNSYSNSTIPISKVANIVGNARGWTADVATSVTLSALANNGGLTQTMAVSAGSVAIGAGNATASNASPVSGLDQRGTTRSATAPTIGAYEYVAATTTTTTTTPAPSTFNFPTSPSTGQVYTFNGIIWVWNGIGWKKRLILPSQDIFMSGNYGGL